LRPKELALLARLALHDGPEERSALAELLFPDAEHPRDTLRWHLSRLRAALPPEIVDCLDTSRARIGLNSETDAHVLHDGAERIIESPDHPDAASILALYRGSLCAGLSVSASADFHNWLYVTEDKLHVRFRQATEAFARVALDNGRAAQAVEPLARLVSVAPYHEEGHLLLIEAYEQLGQLDDARYTYDRYQRIVREELHAQPRESVAARYEPEPPPGPELPLEDFVPLREITMHLLDWPGPEPAVVAIHGSASNAYTLTGVGERISSRVRFISLDLRGHGFSDKPPHGYAVEDHVGDVCDLIRVLRLRRPVLLGHSIGGAIATFAAGEADAGGLILYDAVVGDRAFTENSAAVLERYGPQIDHRLGGFEEYLAAWQMKGEPRTERERWIHRLFHYLAPLPDGTYRMRGLRSALEEEWASARDHDSLAALRRVTVPVLIVHAPRPWWLGERPYLSEAIVRAQLDAARHGELFVAEGSDHSAIVRNPEPELIDALVKFARSLA
jgi:pimeloyl-ACP methyl ester carboxylesterase/DNA-binding SARP family transcriptional activator